MTALEHDIAAPPQVEVVVIEALHDAVLEAAGHHVSTLYAETFWLPVIGPTALWLLRLAARHTTDGPWTVDTEALGRSLGVGGGRHFGKASQLHRTFDRLKQFNCADGGWTSTWRLATHVPPLTRGRIARLPESLQREHDTWRSS